MAELAIAVGRRPVTQADPLPAANEGGQGTAAGGKGQAVAEQHPEHADQGHGRKAHHHGVEHVAAAHEAGVKQRQGGGHHQHQGGADQHKAIVGATQRPIYSEQDQAATGQVSSK